GGDDGVEVSALGGLAHGDAGRRDVRVAAAHERRAGLAEKAHNVIYERRAGDAGTGIFQDEEAAAHTRTARVNRAKPPDGIIKPPPLAGRRAGGPTPPAGGFEGGVGPGGATQATRLWTRGLAPLELGGDATRPARFASPDPWVAFGCGVARPLPARCVR